MRNSVTLPHYMVVPVYVRRLPHIYEIGHAVFLSWSLQDSFPRGRFFPEKTVSSGRAFAAMDRLLDRAREGSLYLRRLEIADMVVEAIQYNSAALGHYALHAFVVMPNHVHLLVTPAVDLPRLTKSLKGITAKRANAILQRSGTPFWQEESYDHFVRDRREFEKIWFYIENNPVRAGLVMQPDQYRWSSAWATGGRPRTWGSAVLSFV